MLICDSMDAFQASKQLLECDFAQVTSLEIPYIDFLVLKYA